MQNSKTRIASLALGAVVCLMAFSSCLKYGDDTIVLPQPTGKIPPSVIPTDLQDSLIHHDFPIHEGVEPPDVEGTYLISENKLIYASDEYQNNFVDITIQFSNQIPRGVLFYQESQTEEHSSHLTGTSIEAGIIGEGNDFTMYCYQLVRVFNPITGKLSYECKQATAVSGTISSLGIYGCRYAYIMLDKKMYDDYYIWRVPPTDTYRTFRDGDGLAARLSPWPNP